MQSEQKHAPPASNKNGTSVFSYVYDRFGNRWQQNGPTNNFLASFTGNNPGNPQNNNRIDGYTYDAAGNLLSDGVNTYTYDAENRITTVKVSGSLTGTYVYDALGQRVEKVTPAGVPNDCNTAGGTTFYLRDLSGHIAVYTQNGVNQCHDYIYAGDRHLATYMGNTRFVHADWLGTERARGFGTSQQTCTSLPFGDALSCSPADNGQYSAHTHFTGKERDFESGLDNFEARYFGSSLGRFMSPDPGGVGAHESSPQSWNAYSYVLNNPLNAVDPDGLDYWLIGGNQCGQNNVQCDKEGYVLDNNGNRAVITDQQLNGSNGLAKFDQNGNLIFTTSQGTFQGQFFDPNPVPPSAIVTLSPEERALMTLQMAGEMGDAQLKEGMLIMATGAADAALVRGLGLLAEGATSGVTFGPSTVGAAQAPLTRELMKETGMTAGEAIGKYKLGSINRVFPGQFRNATLETIENAAKTGDKAARTAIKLLFDTRFNKP